MQDLFNMDENTGMDFLVKKSTTNDGMYRPKLDNAKDKKKGYRAVIRFLPNLTKEGKLGKNAIEKMTHYVKLPQPNELNGYYDSMRNFDEKCDLTNTYWALKNSKSVVDQEKAELISRSTKYYSYVQIIEDENQPELVGKIMVFSFGYKIKQKIAAELTGEISGTPCNIYDLANGKDFVLLVKEVGGFTNYDSSSFRESSSGIKIKDKNDNMREIPTVTLESGRKSVDAQAQPVVMDYLSKREVELEDFAPVRWSDEERAKVARIISFVTDSPIAGANNSISKAGEDFAYASEATSAPSASYSGSEDVDPDDFFDSI
jgi:hypothetical protein